MLGLRQGRQVAARFPQRRWGALAPPHGCAYLQVLRCHVQQLGWRGEPQLQLSQCSCTSNDSGEAGVPLRPFAARPHRRASWGVGGGIKHERCLCWALPCVHLTCSVLVHICASPHVLLAAVGLQKEPRICDTTIHYSTDCRPRCDAQCRTPPPPPIAAQALLTPQMAFASIHHRALQQATTHPDKDNVQRVFLSCFGIWFFVGRRSMKHAHHFVSGRWCVKPQWAGCSGKEGPSHACENCSYS
mmetsp:Transcript_8052/g.12134  ORF Transcript_8052/g.12134 Transcript_8052/m.12134 type:complete len:244 (-) Transcript_8052:286-1017(-)